MRAEGAGVRVDVKLRRLSLYPSVDFVAAPQGNGLNGMQRHEWDIHLKHPTMKIMRPTRLLPNTRLYLIYKELMN